MESKAPEERFTRRQVSDLLGINYLTVRWWEKVLKLHPLKGKNRTWLYSLQDVEDLRLMQDRPATSLASGAPAQWEVTLTLLPHESPGPGWEPVSLDGPTIMWKKLKVGS